MSMGHRVLLYAMGHRSELLSVLSQLITVTGNRGSGRWPVGGGDRGIFRPALVSALCRVADGVWWWAKQNNLGQSTGLRSSCDFVPPRFSVFAFRELANCRCVRRRAASTLHINRIGLPCCFSDSPCDVSAAVLGRWMRGPPLEVPLGRWPKREKANADGTKWVFPVWWSPRRVRDVALSRGRSVHTTPRWGGGTNRETRSLARLPPVDHKRFRLNIFFENASFSTISGRPTEVCSVSSSEGVRNAIELFELLSVAYYCVAVWIGFGSVAMFSLYTTGQKFGFTS